MNLRPRSALRPQADVRSLDIVTHRQERLDDLPYFARIMLPIWRRDWNVRVLSGPARRVEADAAFLHVNLTVAPADHVDFVRRHDVAINHAVVDTSKRHISQHLVMRGEAVEGPVIVKTDLNARGVREARLTARRNILRRLGRRLGRRRPLGSAYEIYNSVEDVPAAVWQDPLWVVERFLPERDGSWFCLRQWHFLGDREVHHVAYSLDPLVKSRNIVARETVREVPAVLRRKRVELGFDFGKFDYGVVDGRVVLYDVNRTPVTREYAYPYYAPYFGHLAEGLASLMNGSVGAA